MTTENNAAAKRRLPWWAWATSLAGAVAFIAALIWGPWWIEGNHLRDGKGNLVSSAGIIVTGFRTMLITIGVGTVGAIGLYYTHRNHELAQQQFEESRRQFNTQANQSRSQFELAQRQFDHAQQQFVYEQTKDRKAAEGASYALNTETYMTAVKMLSSSNSTERLGAIFSLQRIARVSPEDRHDIHGILVTFVRQREPGRNAYNVDNKAARI